MASRTGFTPLKLCTAAHAGDPVPGTMLELAAGMQHEIFASVLGAEGNTFLMVYNPSETEAGGWEVMEGE